MALFGVYVKMDAIYCEQNLMQIVTPLSTHMDWE